MDDKSFPYSLSKIKVLLEDTADEIKQSLNRFSDETHMPIVELDFHYTFALEDSKTNYFVTLTAGIK